MRTKGNTAVKICGITQVNQALQIASLGADAIGVVGVESSKRYLAKKQRTELFKSLIDNAPEVERVLVVANPTEKELSEYLTEEGKPSVIQLQGHYQRVI